MEILEIVKKYRKMLVEKERYYEKAMNDKKAAPYEHQKETIGRLVVKIKLEIEIYKEIVEDLLVNQLEIISEATLKDYRIQIGHLDKMTRLFIRDNDGQENKENFGPWAIAEKEKHEFLIHATDNRKDRADEMAGIYIEKMI